MMYLGIYVSINYNCSYVCMYFRFSYFLY